MRIIETESYQRMKRQALFGGLLAPSKPKTPPAAGPDPSQQIAKNKAMIDRLTTQLNIAKRENPRDPQIAQLTAQIEKLRDDCSSLMAQQYATIGR